jgi:ribose transport system substrate-binding protein
MKSRTMKPLRWLLCCSLTALLAALPACSGKKSNKLKVAFISNNAYEFWTFAKRGTEAAADEFGDVEVEFKMPPEGTVQEQRRFIEDLQAKGVKAIAVSPNNVDSQIDFYTEVNEKIPVVLVDSDVDETKDDAALKARRYYLGTNNVDAGKAVGELVKEVLPKGGELMIFVGKLDVLNAVQRRHGVVVALAGGEDKCAAELEQMRKNKYPIRFGNYELVDTRTDDAKRSVCREKAEDALNKVPGLRCMVGLWEYNPPAMLEALESYKKGAMLGKIALIGFDENEDTLRGIKDGHVHATVVQSPYKFGYDSVKLMVALVRGDDDVVKKYNADKNGRIWVPHRVITKKNVDEFQAELKKLKGS